MQGKTCCQALPLHSLQQCGRQREGCSLGPKAPKHGTLHFRKSPRSYNNSSSCSLVPCRQFWERMTSQMETPRRERDARCELPALPLSCIVPVANSFEGLKIEGLAAATPANANAGELSTTQTSVGVPGLPKCQWRVKGPNAGAPEKRQSLGAIPAAQGNADRGAHQAGSVNGELHR